MLLIVRHGETPPNRQGLLLGRADPSLTDVRSRAGATARRARCQCPTVVVSSPLRRARDTAAAFGRPVEVDERWIELDYGELDGQPSAAVPDDVWARWRADSSFAPAGRRVAGGARRAGCARRVPSCRRPRPASTVVVVTHVSPIKAAIAWALDVPIEIAWRMYVEDASVSRIDIGPRGTGRALVQSWRCCKSTERAEEGVGGVVPRGERLHRVARAAAASGTPPLVVGGQPPQRRAQTGDVAGLDETSLPAVLDEVGQVARTASRPSAVRPPAPRRRPFRTSRRSWGERTRRHRRTAGRPRHA